MATAQQVRRVGLGGSGGDGSTVACGDSVAPSQEQSRAEAEILYEHVEMEACISEAFLAVSGREYQFVLAMMHKFKMQLFDGVVVRVLGDVPGIRWSPSQVRAKVAALRSGFSATSHNASSTPRNGCPGRGTCQEVKSHTACP
jgi:hypothetical protein